MTSTDVPGHPKLFLPSAMVLLSQQHPNFVIEQSGGPEAPNNRIEIRFYKTELLWLI